MEEQLRMYHEYSPSFGREQLTAETENIQGPSINPRRQISMMYGMEFSSKVPLFQRTYSTIQQCGLNLLSETEIHRKVHSFLLATIQNTSEIKTLLSNFQQLDDEMELAMARSKRSISQSSSMSQGSLQASEQDITALKDFSNKKLEKQEFATKTNKNRGSMMKSNRISIADAIKISEFHELKHFVPLESINSICSSTSSVESKEQGLTAFNRNFEILSLSSTGDNVNPKVEPVVKYYKEKSKKISIMMGDLDLSNHQFDSEIFSDQGEPLTLKNLNTPELPFSISVVQEIFDSPCPFLTNLALCLLCKCLARTEIDLTESKLAWLLSVSTIVAYKIYYDEPITGLIDFYSSFLKIQGDEMVLLQRWFLQKVGYEVVVSNRQYQSVLFQLVSR